MIDRKDLRVGLTTTEGSVVTAIGETVLLCAEFNSGLERTHNIANFCNRYTEQCDDEIVELELGVSGTDGSICLLDKEGDRTFVDAYKAIGTGIKLHYNKTKGEFVTVDKCKEGSLVEV